MASKYLLVVGCLCIFTYGFLAIGNEAASAAELHGFNAQDGDLMTKPNLKLNIKHRSLRKATDSVLDSTAKDLNRIQTLYTRIVERGEGTTIMKGDHHNARGPISAPAPSPEPYAAPFSGQLMATLKPTVNHGSWEYLMDVFVGTPPKHFSLIIDTGSDLNWIQCDPCHDCYKQTEPYYNPKESISYKDISCRDPKCSLVSSPYPSVSCKNEDQGCPYHYRYGDDSNSTGDLAYETFTVNLTAVGGKSRFMRVENVMFGCGHWNRGIFNGAAGVLGLGRGPLSFSSQLKSLYGDSFSYCLADRNSNTTSELIFGEDEELLSHGDLNFTTLIKRKGDPLSTFYYVQIKSVVVGGEELDIPEQTWNLSPFGHGGTIVDSGTALSFFMDPAYEIIKDAFVRKVKGYPVIKDFPVFDPCYKVSGVDNLELPSLRFVFRDGAIWDFPVENYFIRLEKDVVCLAFLRTPRSSLSVIGNYQQHNFHILYDTERSRLGFVPRKCGEA